MKPLESRVWVLIGIWIMLTSMLLFAFYTIASRYGIERSELKAEATMVNSLFIVLRIFSNQG